MNIGIYIFTLLVGLVIISVCIGTIYSEVYGFLVLGSGIIFLTLFNMFLTRNKKG